MAAALCCISTNAAFQMDFLKPQSKGHSLLFDLDTVSLALLPRHRNHVSDSVLISIFQDCEVPRRAEGLGRATRKNAQTLNQLKERIAFFTTPNNAFATRVSFDFEGYIPQRSESRLRRLSPASTCCYPLCFCGALLGRVPCTPPLELPLREGV
jgi:hypothetical protein